MFLRSTPRPKRGGNQGDWVGRLPPPLNCHHLSCQYSSSNQRNSAIFNIICCVAVCYLLFYRWGNWSGGWSDFLMVTWLTRAWTLLVAHCADSQSPPAGIGQIEKRKRAMFFDKDKYRGKLTIYTFNLQLPLPNRAYSCAWQCLSSRTWLKSPKWSNLLLGHLSILQLANS